MAEGIKNQKLRLLDKFRGVDTGAENKAPDTENTGETPGPEDTAAEASPSTPEATFGKSKSRRAELQMTVNDHQISQIYSQMSEISLASKESAETIREGLKALREKIAKDHMLSVAKLAIDHANIVTDGSVISLDDKTGDPTIMPPSPDALTSMADIAEMLRSMHAKEATMAEASRKAHTELVNGLRVILQKAIAKRPRPAK